MNINKVSLNFIKSIAEKCPCVISKIVLKSDNYIIVFVDKFYAYNFFVFLKRHISTQFNLLMDLTATDNINNTERFAVIYQLLSTFFNQRISIKICINNSDMISSLYSIYKSAGWLEREVWDLFGIVFSNHPDLRRILTDYGFNGFPLRKDFPLSGFLELVYSEDEKKVLYLPLEFFQEYRFFDFRNSWQ